MKQQTVKNILDAAVRAPSGDNVQPWHFDVSDDYKIISLYNVPERDGSYFNYKQLASLISHGAVIENIIIAAEYFGYKANVDLFPDEKDINFVAKITLEASEECQKDNMHPSIFRRYTNRGGYKSYSVSEQQIKVLEYSVSGVSNANVFLVSDKGVIKKLAKVLMLNDRLVFEREDIHRFLFNEIRWTEEEVAKTKDGMPVDTLGLNFIEKLFFPMMRFWKFIELGNILGLSKIIGLKCWWNCRGASIIGMITIDFDNRYGFIQGGRAMQRLWLAATEQRLSFQPIAGLPLLIYRMNSGKLDGFSGKQQHQIKMASEHMLQLFEINKQKTMVMGFRIGFGKELSIRTERKSVF